MPPRTHGHRLIAMAGTGTSALLIAAGITLTTAGTTIYNVNQVSLRCAGEVRTL